MLVLGESTRACFHLQVFCLGATPMILCGRVCLCVCVRTAVSWSSLHCVTKRKEALCLRDVLSSQRRFVFPELWCRAKGSLAMPHYDLRGVRDLLTYKCVCDDCRVQGRRRQTGEEERKKHEEEARRESERRARQEEDMEEERRREEEQRKEKERREDATRREEERRRDEDRKREEEKRMEEERTMEEKRRREEDRRREEQQLLKIREDKERQSVTLKAQLSVSHEGDEDEVEENIGATSFTEDSPMQP